MNIDFNFLISINKTFEKPCIQCLVYFDLFNSFNFVILSFGSYENVSNIVDAF